MHDRCGGNRVGPSGGSCRCGDLVASIHDCIVILQGWEFDHRFFDRIDLFRYRFDHGRPFSKIDEIVSIMVEFFERSKY